MLFGCDYYVNTFYTRTMLAGEALLAVSSENSSKIIFLSNTFEMNVQCLHILCNYTDE